MIAYLAHPIDAATDPAAAARVRLAVEVATKSLSGAGFEVYRPNAAWHAKGSNPDPRVQETNMATMLGCDVLVALLPPGIPTIGVVLEIAEAHRVGMPLVVWRPDIAPSYALASMSLTVVQSLEAIVPAIEAKQVVSRGRPVLVQVLRPDGRLPVRPYHDDAGFDLAAAEPALLMPGQSATIPTGLAVQFPVGFWGLILPRSSISARDLHVPSSVIDPGWRGELSVRLVNIGGGKQIIEVGDRLAQIVPLPLAADTMRLAQVEALGDHPRGLSGFGSSGK